MTGKTPRRDFLLGRSGGSNPESVVGGDELAPPPLPEPYLVRLARKAMACEFEVCLPAAIAGEAAAFALEALDLVQSIESQLSYFKSDSDVCEINRHAAEGPVDVEPRLFSLLQFALEVWQESRGAYDITAAPLWEVWGFARRAGAIPTPEQLNEAQSRVGGQFVELDASAQTIRFTRPGVQINLGSIGKGYAVDRCVELLQAAGVEDFLVHGGYSSVAACGYAERHASKTNEPIEGSSHPRLGTPWTVGVKDPLRDDRRLGELALRDRAMGTSGTQFQSFRHQGRRYGHILDPRSGWPSDSTLSATVLAPKAAEADAWSTAFYVMGPLAALEFCGKRPQFAAVLFAPANQPRGWEMHECGLSPLAGGLSSGIG